MNRELSEAADWYRALTLAERIALLSPHITRPSTNGAAGIDDRHLERWRSEAGFPSKDTLAQRLAVEGISEGDFYTVLSEQADRLRARVTQQPWWLAEVHAAFRQATDSPAASTVPIHPVGSGALTELLGVIEPILSRAHKRVHTGGQRLIRTHCEPPIDESVIDVLGTRLVPQLLRMLSQAMALELHIARLEGRLAGSTPEERFTNFIAQISEPGRAFQFLEKYPVLARQLVTGAHQWTVTSLEFLNRLCKDWPFLCAAIDGLSKNDLLIDVDDYAGDPHRRGRRVIVATFRSGARVVYKPRPMALDQHFQMLLAWLNKRGDHPPFRLMEIVDRGSYGWSEYVPAYGCSTTDEVERFYRRQGAYLALLRVLGATDFHYENLVASGEHPMLLDLETLFHPQLESDSGVTDQYAPGGMTDSVLRVGLLPYRLWESANSDGIDLSGLGATSGQTTPFLVQSWEGVGTDDLHLIRKSMVMPKPRSQPVLQGEPIATARHVERVVDGFVQMYHLLLEYRGELLSEAGPLGWFRDDEVRVAQREFSSPSTA
ncbi:hypothetical protein GCM10011579_067450 [Streptomyces albiflavescens]|uniref:Lantibiotic biosynthesis protein dehydration domain-containing protein n=1 Tax=Streptomyces albiflavescens TaxID=1623582 RepID=A0A917YAW2_9ACTN|nr:hypothetical protein GCM10011579_067450 [Streptomyces albiflavescens]